MTHLKSTSFQMTAGAIALALMVPCLLLLIPLLIITCDCRAGKISSDRFVDLYVGNGEHLIAYNTEGKGEDKTPPQSPLHWQNTNRGLKAANVKSVSTAVRETHHMESMQQLLYTHPELFHREASHNYFGSSHSHNIDTMFESHMQRTVGVAEDMTITAEFLENYFNENCVPHLEDKYPAEVWEYEGQGSTTGSLSSCTCQDITDNLEFLTDLGTKFKTLAEICSPPSSTVRSSLKQTAMTALRSTSDVVKPVKSVIETRPVIETKRSNVTTEKATNVSSSSSSKVSTSHSSMTLPQSSITNGDHSSHMGYSSLLHYPTQAVTLQQPFCYNTVVQPVQYMMAPNLENTVLLEDWSGATNLSGMVMFNGSQGLSGPFVSGAPGSLTGLVTSNTGFLTSDTGLVTSNTGLVTSNTGFLTSDTGLVTPNTGLVTSNTGFLTSNTGLITSNTEGCVNFQSSPSSVSPVGATVLLPGSPASGELVSPGSFSMDSWRIMPPNSGDSYMLLPNGSLEVEEEEDDLERLLMVSN